MITKEQLIERHRDLVGYSKSKDSHYGSIPQPMFKGGLFNRDNWNGGDGIIRQLTNWLERQPRERFTKEEIEFDNKEIDLIANWDYFNDQSYIQMALHIFDEEIEEWYFRQYLITYYKSRGKTDMIYKNGEIVTFDDYVWLVNMLEAAGYEFDLEI